MHKLLERQLKKLRRKFSGDNLLLEALIEVVTATYEEADIERRKKERSMKLMSDELLILNSRIKEESESYISTIMENLVDGIATFDEEGIILSFNSQMQKIFLISEDKAIGQHISILSPEINGVIKNYQHIYDNELKIMDTGKVLETSAIDRNDRIFPIDLTISKMEGTEKNIYISIVRDITERKKFENELIMAKEAAEQAAIAKTNFLSTMSHEIRTPMNAVIGLTNVLLQENPRSDQLESLEVLKFSGENLLVLINDILDYNKIESGKIEFESINFSLKHIANSIKNGLNVKALEKGLKLKVYIDSSLPEVVMGDSVRLSQILNNLVGNSVKFTNTGKITVDISLRSETKKEIYVDFEVIDTGIGIPKDKINHIFESFTQSNSTITRKYGGTGLGLAITKKLLELQGSEIHVESEEGKGSTFIFCMKFEKSESPNIKASESQKKTVAIETFTGNKILLVEDNKINQMVATKFLTKWGLDVDFAENGEIACEKVLNTDYDLVLMDLQMPELDGYSATENIRNFEDPKFKDLPIIALTASAMQPIMARVMDAGMNDFISKPFNPFELNKKIHQYIRKPVPSL